jgi:hypothetical protein
MIELPKSTHVKLDSAADAIVARAARTGVCAVDTETTGLYWALGHTAFCATFCYSLDEKIVFVDDPAIAKRILNGLVAANVKLVFHNAIFDLHMLRMWSWRPQSYRKINLADTMHGFRILFPGTSARLKEASLRYAADVDVTGPQLAVKEWLSKNPSRKMVPVTKKLERNSLFPEQTFGSKVVTVEPSYDEVPRRLMIPYATQDAWLTLKCYFGLLHDFTDDAKRQRVEIDMGKTPGLTDIPTRQEVWERECELVLVTAHMEHQGLTIDIAKIEAGIAMASPIIAEYERQWYADATRSRYDYASNQQLSDYLYTVLGEQVRHRTDRDTPSTDVLAITDLANTEVREILLPLRGWLKYKQKLVELRDWRNQSSVEFEYPAVHASLRSDAARTGRFSASNPQLHNTARPIPGRPHTMVRDVFGPRGCEWLFADFSQIELRFAAEFMRDKIAIEAFENGIDMHSLTASRMYGVPLEEVTKQQRNLAKTVNFAILYGAGVGRIAQGLRYGQGGSDPVSQAAALATLNGLQRNGKFVWLEEEKREFDPDGCPPDRGLPYPVTPEDIYATLATVLVRMYHRENPLARAFTDSMQRYVADHAPGGNRYCGWEGPGFIRTAFGLHIPIDAGLEYKAGNAMIQGSAAGVMKETLLRSADACERFAADNGYTMWKDVAVLFSIHDEVIFRVPTGRCLDIIAYLDPMLTDWRFSVPLKLDYAYVPDGGSWAFKQGMSSYAGT